MVQDIFNECASQSVRRVFGLCDDIPGQKAYIDEGANGANWVATVINTHEETIYFTAIDNCIQFPQLEGGLDSERCDGVLTTEDMVSFVELKSSTQDGAAWLNKAISQLITSIKYFDEQGALNGYTDRRAYVCNSFKPQARRGQAERIQRFSDKAGGFILYVKATVNLRAYEG
jgi:hypothetical protein